MRARTTANYIVIALAAVLTAAVVLLPAVSSEAVYPIENARRTLIGRIGARISGCFRGAAAAAENAKLKREVAALAILRGDVERLEAENARLRAALAYSGARRGEWLAAAVLSRGGSAAANRLGARGASRRLFAEFLDAVRRNRFGGALRARSFGG